MVDEFPRVPCGDMMGRLDVLMGEWLKNTDERIAVVYFGHRYRKGTKFGKDGKPAFITLSYPHRDDGLNWAKGIPKYLFARLSDWNEQGERLAISSRLKEKLILINGGYRDDLRTEIWFVPPSAPDPTPIPLLNESDVRFGSKEPYRVPDYYNCYSRYE